MSLTARRMPLNEFVVWFELRFYLKGYVRPKFAAIANFTKVHKPTVYCTVPWESDHPYLHTIPL